jgi:hypothetical protein
VAGWGVNVGRIMVRSEKSKNRAPVDPFEAFFHPERMQGDFVAANASPAPFNRTTHSADDVVSINPTRQVEQTSSAAGETNGHQTRPVPQLINAITT